MFVLYGLSASKPLGIYIIEISQSCCKTIAHISVLTALVNGGVLYICLYPRMFYSRIIC